MKKRRLLFDLEIYRNFFCCGFKDYDSKEIIYFEVSERMDQRKEIYDFFQNYTGILISYNGIYYDNVVIKALLKEWKTLKRFSTANFCSYLKDRSDEIINQDFTKTKKFSYHSLKWFDVDLFLYWSKMLRISKKLSLKSLGIQMNYPVVQELPFSPESILKVEDLDVIKEYNTVHDLGILEMLVNEMKGEIELRQSIRDDYNLDCLSWDAPKIASEVLLKEYCNVTKKDPSEVKLAKFRFSNCKIGDVIADVNFEFRNSQLQEIYKEICNSSRDFSKQFVFTHEKTNLIISLGIGGIHSILENKKYVSSKGQRILSSDIALIMAQLKFLKLTGISLKFYLLNYCSNIIMVRIITSV